MQFCFTPVQPQIQMEQRPRFETIQKFQQALHRKQIIKNKDLDQDVNLSSHRGGRNGFPDYRKKQEYQRESQPCNQVRYQDQTTSQPSPNLSSSPKYNISSGMMKILIEENANLKQQNKYLHNKLRDMSLKEGDLIDTILQYEAIMATMNAQNQQLQKEVMYFSGKANNKVDKLGKKLSKLVPKKQHLRDKELSNQNIEQSQSNADPYEKYFDNREADLHINPIKRIKSQQRMLDRKYLIHEPERVSASLDNINSEFQSLLYACRMQTNPEKRKELRRRLVELTYKKTPVQS